MKENNTSIKTDNNIKGLSSKEANELLKKYGKNAIEEKKESWWHRLFRRFWGPIPWMIEIAAILSAIAKRWEDFAVIIVMLFINAFVDFYQESKALNAIEVLKKKLAKKALVLRDDKWQIIDATLIVPGDIIKIKIGDIVPADVVIVSSNDYLLVDQSALTGESLPVTKKVGDMLYANSIIKQGEAVAKVVATALNTYFGKTVNLVAKAEQTEYSHFQKMVIKVGNFLIYITLIMIAIIVYHGFKTHQPTMDLLIFALVLTISAIPVAMPAVLTVTMAVGAKTLATFKAIVSRLASIEELAGMDILCSDKTGTLTQNKMTINKPYLVGNFSEDDLLLLAALASKEENHDPIEMPIFEYLKTHNLYSRLKKYKLEKFIPFNPVIKRTEAIVIGGSKTLDIIKGAPQVIIEMCNEKSFDKQEAYKMVENFANKGFRTLGVAYKEITQNSFTFVGLIPLYDPPREDSKETIADVKAHGVEVKMVTGDNVAVAKYIAKILGIGDDIRSIKELKGESSEEYIFLAKIIGEALYKKLAPQNVSKEELEAFGEEISKEVKKLLLDKPLPKGSIKKHESEIIAIIEKANGFAEVFPEDKYFIVDELQKANHIVGMTGDGVNDAPALKKADCGIAVSGATDAARAAADLVLLEPGLSVINKAIKLARVTFERMKSYTVYRIAETIRIILFMTLSIVIFDFYPITAIMIILLALLNDIPIMAIAYDNTKIDKKPVRWDMKAIFVLSSWLGVAGVLSSFTIFYITMVYLKSHPESAMYLPDVPSWVDMKDEKSFLGFVQTLFFVKLIIAGHFTIFNTRQEGWFFQKPYPSWVLLVASLSTALIGTALGIYTFGLMTPITWQWALFLWGYVIAWFIFNDIVKRLVLSYYKKKYKEEVL